MIVTLDMVKEELGVIDDDQDSFIARKLSDAEAITIDYLKVAADNYEDVDGNNDFPQIVAAAVILVAKMLYEDPEAEPISKAVENILRRQRDPAAV